MDTRFIKNYPEEELDSIDELLEEAYTRLPFSIVSPLKNYEDCIERKLYDRAFKSVLDFFEISIQFTSGFIISLLNHLEIAYDDEMREVLKKIVDKPLSFGDWVNDIFLVLIRKSQEYIPENAVVKQLYQDLFIGPNGKIVTKKIEEFKQIVGIRNSSAHDTTWADEIYLEELGKIEPRIWKMLAMLRPLSAYRFFAVQEVIESDEESKPYTILVDEGAKEPDPDADGLRIYSDGLLDEHAYYVTDQKIRRKSFLEGKSIIRLSPFVIYHSNNEVTVDEKFHYVFQSLGSKNLKRMVFVSSHKKAKRMETELFKDKFWTLLERIFGFLIHQEKYKISISNEKSLDEYEERLLAQTNIFLNQQINSDKYDPNVFLDRSYLSSSYDDFKTGEYPAYVMLGDAGAGKTNQICHWASDKTSGMIPLALYSKNFSQLTLEAQLQQTFNEPGKPAASILEAFEEALEKSGAFACILFDAINECNTYKGGEPGNGAIDLLTAIDKLFIQEKFRHIKLVISCRSYTWEELLNKDGLQKDRYYTVSDLSHVTLKGFSADEFSLVYPKYALKYNLATTLEQLQEDRYAFVKTRLYDPLILKTASQNFTGREFPVDLIQFNSTRLFEQRLDALENKADGPRQLSILEDFTAILWQDYTDAIPLKLLHRAYEDSSDPMHEFALRIFKNETYRYHIAFIGLLEEGILRIEKSIKREVRFVYERFNEYLFARHFLLSESSQRFKKVPVPASLYEQVLKTSGHSTVIIAALRNALIMDFYEKSHDPAAIVQLSLSQVYESQPLVEETLSVLMDENYLDVLGILEHMLTYEKEETRDLLTKREELETLLNKDKKKPRLSETVKESTHARLQDINETLLKIARIRKIAISIIYKIFKTDRADRYIADERTDPNRLLSMAMSDPLPEVRDNASIYIYYIARFNIARGMHIISALSEKVMKTPMTALLKQTTRKTLQQSHIEPAARVGLFLVIDGLIERRDYTLALEILNTWKRIVSKFTLNHALIKMVMPFFKFLFARQTVVQTEYVNNAIEYRHFWDTTPVRAPSPGWSQEAYGSLVPYLDASAADFRRHESVIMNGYLTGDSFSLFLLERILIVQGVADWDNVSELVHRLSHLSDTEPFRDYIEMSLIYSLSQINLKSPEKNPQAERIFASLVYTWSVRNKGFYYAHYNNMANGGRPYKHYILNWYAAVYCHYYGDGQTKPGDEYSAPVLRDLIDLAYRKKDKALLYNCIENIAMLVPSAGYYKTSLQLFEHLIGLFKTESELQEFDLIVLDGRLYQKGLRSFLCDMLGTVKSYYPKEVDHFIVNKLKASRFPDLDAFREEIFNHSLSHEGIGDLLTHKFGNFVIWGILNDPDIRRFFIQICRFGPVARNYTEWFDNCVRHIFREVFGVKNL